MARRNRYRELENLLTRVLLADVAVFLLYLLFAGLGVGFLKWTLAIVAIVGSGLFAGVLYLNGEWRKRRSQWMFMGFAAIALCTLVSLLCKFPAPAIK
jgi:ABC-type Fe3+-siderophore transport system permease subunit